SYRRQLHRRNVAGRGRGIRTPDFCVPNATLYQTELYPAVLRFRYHCAGRLHCRDARVAVDAHVTTWRHRPPCVIDEKMVRPERFDPGRLLVNQEVRADTPGTSDTPGGPVCRELYHTLAHVTHRGGRDEQ